MAKTPEEKQADKAEKAMYRALAAQLLILGVAATDKGERALAVADAMESAAAMIRQKYGPAA